MKKAILILSLIVFSGHAFSNEEYACVQVQKVDGSWGSWYKIPYFYTTGADLNKATNSYNFNSWEKIIIGTWPNGGYSVVKIGPYDTVNHFGSITSKDQNDKGIRFKAPPSYGDCQ